MKLCPDIFEDAAEMLYLSIDRKPFSIYNFCHSIDMALSSATGHYNIQDGHYIFFRQVFNNQFDVYEHHKDESSYLALLLCAELVRDGYTVKKCKLTGNYRLYYKNKPLADDGTYLKPHQCKVCNSTRILVKPKWFNTLKRSKWICASKSCITNR